MKRNSSINVGRIQGDIVLRDDKSISRNHASVSVEPKVTLKKGFFYNFFFKMENFIYVKCNFFFRITKTNRCVLSRILAQNMEVQL